MLASVDAKQLPRNRRRIEEIAQRRSDIFGIGAALQHRRCALAGEVV